MKTKKYKHLSVKNNLLYLNDKLLDIPEADEIAKQYGFVYAEQLVEKIKEELIK